MKVQLNMSNVQGLITAVNESNLPREEKHTLRVKLDDMQDELLSHNKLMVVGIPNAWLKL